MSQVTQPVVAASRRRMGIAIAYGDVDLSAGRHTVTLTVTGRNQAAIGYLAGLDYFRFTLGG